MQIVSIPATVRYLDNDGLYDACKAYIEARDDHYISLRGSDPSEGVNPIPRSCRRKRTMSGQSKRRMIDGDRLLTQLNDEFRKAQTCNPNDPWLPGLGLAACMVRDLIGSTDDTCNFRNPGWEERAKEGG